MASFGQWRGFEAAHIFPLEKELLWIKEDCQRWITDIDDERDTKINSPQNGLLLRADIHSLFDDYLVSVNPDVSDSLRELTFVFITKIVFLLKRITTALQHLIPTGQVLTEGYWTPRAATLLILTVHVINYSNGTSDKRFLLI